MQLQYTVTPGDLNNVKGEFSKLPKLNIGETIHWDKLQNPSVAIDSLIEFLFANYDFKRFLPVEMSNDWAVFKITGLR